MSSLSRLVRPELIFPELPGADAPTVLKALADRVAPHLPSTSPEDLYSKLVEREELGSTGIGAGVAIPHCKVGSLEEAVLAVGVVPVGVDFSAVDGQSVRLFFLLVSPERSPAAHLQALASISRWVKNDRHVERILDSPERQAIHRLLVQDDARDGGPGDGGPEE